MADNFNLRQFLTENKLTKNTQLLSEVSDYGFDELMDAADDLYPEGTPENGKLVFAIEKALHANQIDTSDFGHDPGAAYRAVEAIADEIGLGDEQANDIEQAQHDIERQYEETVKENKMTQRDKYLTRLVENALGLQVTEDDNVDYTMGHQNDPNQLPNPAPELNIPEGDEMVQEKPMPKYENIEKLMQEIDKSTDEAAHKHKMQEMKRVADMLEKKCTALEEGEDSDHIDQKKLKQMKKDIMTLRKGIEKMEKLGEKKFAKKETKETKAELKEGFDLRKFLVENKLTTSSRMLNEQAQYKDGDTVDIEGDDWRVYKAFSGNKDNMAAAIEFVKQNIQIIPFDEWYKGEFEGGRPVRTSEPVYILTGMDEKGMGIEHGPQIVLQDDIDDGFLSYGNTGELEGDYDDQL